VAGIHCPVARSPCDDRLLGADPGDCFYVFVHFIMRLLGFDNLDEIRLESVEQNNPTPAILFVGALIASILFLLLVVRP
jgi:hypothetical protein